MKANSMMKNKLDSTSYRGEFRFGHRVARAAWGVTGAVSALCAGIIVFGPLSDQRTWELADRNAMPSQLVAASHQPADAALSNLGVQQ